MNDAPRAYPWGVRKSEDRLTYKHWYAGHYHTEKDIDRLTLLFESIREFSEE